MAARKKAPPAPTAYTLEDLLTSAAGFGLTTATPVQRAICRAAEGLPLGDLAADPAVPLALGGPEAIERLCGRPLELVLLSGIRAGKSLIVAALAVYASQTVDLSLLGAGEMARVSVLSLSLDTAKVVYGHVVGNVLSKPALRALLAEEPTSDTVVLRHPSGRLVEIKIVAGAKAGGTLVARWSAGVIFDEAPRMSGDEAVVNFPDARASALGRLLPGAQLVALGSPWAPAGPIYDTVMERWGKPGADLLVIKAPAPAMNPVWWTPERVAEFRARNPDLARTEIDAEFADPEAALLSSVDLDACTRQTPTELPPDPRCSYVAAIDPAARGNAWTLVLGTREAGKVRVALVRQWIGSKVSPLSPAAVLAEMATLLRPYRCERVLTDQWASDALRDLGRPLGLHLVERAWTAGNKFEAFESMRVRVALRGFDLPPDPVLRADLLAVRKRVTTTGVTVVLPETSDGRHADYAPALAMLAGDWIEEPPASLPQRSPDEAAQAAIKAMLDRKATAWWERGQPRFGRLQRPLQAPAPHPRHASVVEAHAVLVPVVPPAQAPDHDARQARVRPRVWHEEHAVSAAELARLAAHRAASLARFSSRQAPEHTHGPVMGGSRFIRAGTSRSPQTQHRTFLEVARWGLLLL